MELFVQETRSMLSHWYVQTSQFMRYTAITRKENPEANTLKNISVNELLEKKLVLHSNVSLEENIFYRLLKYYGEPKIQYVMDNTSLYLDFMNTDNYWSLARILHEYIPVHMILGIVFILCGSLTNILPGLLHKPSARSHCA